MGKYGNGVSMKDAIKMDVERTIEILDRSNLSDEDKSEIVDTVKELAYQWCYTNAFACALEEVATANMSKEEFAKFGKFVMESPTIYKRMMETYPF